MTRFEGSSQGQMNMNACLSNHKHKQFKIKIRNGKSYVIKTLFLLFLLTIDASVFFTFSFLIYLNSSADHAGFFESPPQNSPTPEENEEINSKDTVCLWEHTIEIISYTVCTALFI